MSGIFITGTDTEIGKTFVSTVLIKLLVEEGLQVAVMKPIASGAKIIDGVLKNEDALSLMQASNMSLNYEDVNSYVFEPAMSPHLAAEQAGIKINFDKIKNNFTQLEKKSDVVVVEGVGGWYAPLTYHATVCDLAKVLDQPIILVVGLRLGCLNHALLTAQAIKQSGLHFAGWIANFVDENFSSAEKNIETLKVLLSDVSYLGYVPYVQDVKEKNYNNKSLELCQNTIKTTNQTAHVDKELLLEYLLK